MNSYNFLEETFILLQEHLIAHHQFQKIAQSINQFHSRKVATEYKSLIQ